MEISRDVLIVEDDECTRTLLATLVEYYGYRCTTASDGAGAISRINAKDFPILLLDLLVPGQNGFEVLRHIQCTKPDLLPRTIVITAAAPQSYSGCREIGSVRRVFRKPIELDELMAEIFALTAGAIETAARIEGMRTSGRKERET